MAKTKGVVDQAQQQQQVENNIMATRLEEAGFHRENLADVPEAQTDEQVQRQLLEEDGAQIDRSQAEPEAVEAAAQEQASAKIQQFESDNGFPPTPEQQEIILAKSREAVNEQNQAEIERATGVPPQQQAPVKGITQPDKRVQLHDVKGGDLTDKEAEAITEEQNKFNEEAEGFANNIDVASKAKFDAKYEDSREGYSSGKQVRDVAARLQQKATEVNFGQNLTPFVLQKIGLNNRKPGSIMKTFADTLYGFDNPDANYDRIIQSVASGVYEVLAAASYSKTGYDSEKVEAQGELDVRSVLDDITSAENPLDALREAADDISIAGQAIVMEDAEAIVGAIIRSANSIEERDAQGRPIKTSPYEKAKLDDRQLGALAIGLAQSVGLATADYANVDFRPEAKTRVLRIARDGYDYIKSVNDYSEESGVKEQGKKYKGSPNTAGSTMAKLSGKERADLKGHMRKSDIKIPFEVFEYVGIRNNMETVVNEDNMALTEPYIEDLAGFALEDLPFMAPMSEGPAKQFAERFIGIVDEDWTQVSNPNASKPSSVAQQKIRAFLRIFDMQLENVQNNKSLFPRLRVDTSVFRTYNQFEDLNMDVVYNRFFLKPNPALVTGFELGKLDQQVDMDTVGAQGTLLPSFMKAYRSNADFTGKNAVLSFIWTVGHNLIPDADLKTVEQVLSEVTEGQLQQWAQEGALLREFQELSKLLPRSPEQDARYEEIAPQVQDLMFNDPRFKRKNWGFTAQALVDVANYMDHKENGTFFRPAVTAEIDMKSAGRAALAADMADQNVLGQVGVLFSKHISENGNPRLSYFKEVEAAVLSVFSGVDRDTGDKITDVLKRFSRDAEGNYINDFVKDFGKAILMTVDYGLAPKAQGGNILAFLEDNSDFYNALKLKFPDLGTAKLVDLLLQAHTKALKSVIDSTQKQAPKDMISLLQMMDETLGGSHYPHWGDGKHSFGVHGTDYTYLEENGVKLDAIGIDMNGDITFPVGEHRRDPTKPARSKKDEYGAYRHPHLGSYETNAWGPASGQLRESIIMIEGALHANQGREGNPRWMFSVHDALISDSTSILKYHNSLNNHALPKVYRWRMMNNVIEDFIGKFGANIRELDKNPTDEIDVGMSSNHAVVMTQLHHYYSQFDSMLEKKSGAPGRELSDGDQWYLDRLDALTTELEKIVPENPWNLPKDKVSELPDSYNISNKQMADILLLLAEYMTLFKQAEGKGPFKRDKKQVQGALKALSVDLDKKHNEMMKNIDAQAAGVGINNVN